MVLLLCEAVLISLLLCLFLTSNADVCTDSCDKTYATGIAVTFCGTDFLTHSTFYDALHSDCYNLCNVAAQYTGVCGCPNNCFAEFGQGTCDASLSSSLSSCSCSPGYTGADCSLPSVGNKCSLHGTLITPTSSNSVFPFPYCACDSGYTGSECQSVTFDGDNTPWGNIYNNDVYTSNDKYGDDHPVWDISKMATIHVACDPTEFLQSITPDHLFDDDYISCSVAFDNKKVQQTFSQVGYKLKGASSRLGQKRGFYLKFNEYVSGQKLTDIKKLGLKAASVDDDTLLKNMLHIDMSRAMGVPVQRASYANVFVNNINFGVYFMHEDISTDFIQSRIANDDGSGNFMKLFYDVNLAFAGDNVSYYQNQVTTNCLGASINYYTQESGNGDWSDFLQFLNFNSNSNDDDFAAHINDNVEVDTLLKQMVVESFLMAADNIANNNNFYAYHLQNPSSTSAFENNNDNYYYSYNSEPQLLRGGKSFSSKTAKWQLIEFDFDELFVYDATTGLPREESNVFKFFWDEEPDIDPLTTRMLSLDTYNNTYKKYYNDFLDQLFGSNTKIQPSVRYTNMLTFLMPFVQKDFLWQFSYAITFDEFVLDAESSSLHLPQRYQSVYEQINGDNSVNFNNNNNNNE